MSISISGTGAVTGATTSYSFDQSVTARSGVHVTGGSVGIGTDETDKKLSIGSTGDYLQTHGIGVYNPHSLGLRNGILVHSNKAYNNTPSYKTAAFKAVGTTGNALGISTDANDNGIGGTLDAYIKFDGSAYFAGDVGIGSTTPSTRLTIDNTTPIDTTQTAIAGELGNIYLEMSSGGTQGAGNLGPSINFTGINQSGIDGRKAAIIAQQTGSNSSQVGLSFWTNNTDDSSGVIQERMVINANGNVGINTDSAAVELSIGGTIRVQNSADATQYLSIDYQGLNFQNTGAGSSSTAAAHLLDDYEEGTWTPTFTNGTWTYGKQHGRYTKIGNTVHITSIITWTNRSGTGDLQIELPFLTLGTVTQDRYVGSIGYLSGVDLDSPEKQLINTVSGDRTGLGFFVVVDNAGSVTTKVQNTSTVGEVQSSITIMVS